MINKDRRREVKDRQYNGYDFGFRQRARQRARSRTETSRNHVARDSDDALVCCIENMVKDHIMDSDASFHANYCKEELERFKLRSGKVRLADDKTLDIAGIGDVVLKTSFGYHVRPSGRSRTVKVTKGSLVVAHVNKSGSLYMVEVNPEGIGTIINGSGRCVVCNTRDLVIMSSDWWFGEAEESFLHNVSEDKETTETIAGVTVVAQMKCDTAFGIRRVTKLSKAEILHLWTRFMKPENDSIVLEHSLSSENTQSLGGSSNKSEGSKNSGSFEDSGRRDEEYSEDGASSKKGGSETPQMVSLEKNQTYSLVRISARKKASQRFWMFKVKEEHNGRKRYKATLEPSYVGALNDTSTQQKCKSFQLARQEENLECRLKEILYRLIQASRLWYLKFDSFIQKDKALTWQNSTSLSGSCP
ncbi:hypothetical protein Tco_1169013 [Tanacetum coccineum]